MSQSPKQTGGLHQIGVNYRPIEDRMILIITMTDQSQIHAAMTRRFVKTLWPVLLKMMDGFTPADVPAEKVAVQTPQAKEAIRAFQHQESLQKAQITKTRGNDQAPETKVLNKEPILLAKIAVKPGQANQTQILALFPQNGQGLELGLNQTMLHSLCRIIIEANQQAGWELDLQVPGSSAVVLAQGGGKLN